MLLYARLAAPRITLICLGVCGALFTEPFGAVPHAAHAAPAASPPTAGCIDQIAATAAESPRDAAGRVRSGAENAGWPGSAASGNPDDVQPSPPMRVMTPEAGPWPGTLWPTLDDDEQSDAVDALRAATHEMVASSGAILPVIDTEFFIVATDLSRERTAQWLPLLDDGHRRMLRFLGLSSEFPPDPGRIAIIVLADRDRFSMMQAREFDQLIPTSVQSVMHARELQTFVFVHVDDDGSLESAEILDRIHSGTARAILHLHLSPRRLPLWANEGVAVLLSAAAETGSARAQNVRSLGVAAMRTASPRDLSFLFTLDYADEPWPDAQTPALTAGAVITWLMYQDRRREFLAWIRSVKLGTDWQEALRSSFGTDPATLLETSQRFYRVNN